jgi:hypothetical protein
MGSTFWIFLIIKDVLSVKAGPDKLIDCTSVNYNLVLSKSKL